MPTAATRSSDPADAGREELALPGRRFGHGTRILWDYMSRDEQQKTRNRGAGHREAQQPEHPRRRATDRP